MEDPPLILVRRAVPPWGVRRSYSIPLSEMEEEQETGFLHPSRPGGCSRGRSVLGAHRARSVPGAHRARYRGRSVPGAHRGYSVLGAHRGRSVPGAHRARYRGHSVLGAHRARSSVGTFRAHSRAQSPQVVVPCSTLVASCSAGPALASCSSYISRPSSTPQAWPTVLTPDLPPAQSPP